MKIIITLFFILIFKLCAAQDPSTITSTQNSVCCKSTLDIQHLERYSLEQVASEYKRLKSSPCRDCRNWNGDLHLIMTHLVTGLKTASKKKVKAMLGKPNQEDRNELIYFWRGYHDYIFFRFKKSERKCGWYYAYE